MKKLILLVGSIYCSLSYGRDVYCQEGYGLGIEYLVKFNGETLFQKERDLDGEEFWSERPLTQKVCEVDPAENIVLNEFYEREEQQNILITHVKPKMEKEAPLVAESKPDTILEEVIEPKNDIKESPIVTEFEPVHILPELAEPKNDEKKESVILNSDNDLQNKMSPYDFLKSESLKMGEPFYTSNGLKTEDEAHLEAGKRYYWACKEAKQEVFWWVYKLKDGTYTFSYPNMSDKDNLAVNVFVPGSIYNPISSSHIHWNDFHEFSLDDWGWASHKFNKDKQTYLMVDPQNFYKTNYTMAKINKSRVESRNMDEPGDKVNMEFNYELYSSLEKVNDHFNKEMIARTAKEVFFEVASDASETNVELSGSVVDNNIANP